jgi:hypothetical protein
MDRTRTNNDEHSIVVASQYACSMVTSGGDSALGLWSRADFMAKESRLNERFILGAYSERKKESKGAFIHL